MSRHPTQAAQIVPSQRPNSIYSLDNILERFDVGILKLGKIRLDVVVEIDLMITITWTKFESKQANALSHK